MSTSIARSRKIDPRIGAARGRAAVAKREVLAERQTPEYLAEVTEELRQVMVTVTFERSASDVAEEIKAGNLTQSTYETISKLYEKATAAALTDGLRVG